MAGRRALARGWHPDPYDPSYMRHWNGRYWSLQRRPLPHWAAEGTAELRADNLTAVREGPAHLALLPAGAAFTPGLSPHAPLHPEPDQAQGPGGPGVYDGSVEHDRGSFESLPHQRSALSVAVTLLLVAALVVGASASLARTGGGSLDPPTSTPSFVRTANIDCTAAMTSIRLAADQARGGHLSGPAVAAVAAANQRLSTLVNELQSLPVPAAQQATIRAWLGLWAKFGRDRAAEAQFVAAHPVSSAASLAPFAGAVSLDVTQADATAQLQKLGDCTLSAPSTGPVTAT